MRVIMRYIVRLFCKHDWIVYSYSSNVEYFKCKKCYKLKDVWVNTYNK